METTTAVMMAITDRDSTVLIDIEKIRHDIEKIESQYGPMSEAEIKKYADKYIASQKSGMLYTVGSSGDSRYKADEITTEDRLALLEWEKEERERKRREAEERLMRSANNAEATDQMRDYLRPAQHILIASQDAAGAVFPDGHVEVYYSIPENISTGRNPKEVENFTNVKQLVATKNGFVALLRDGTCRATNPGKDCPSRLLQANRWTNVVALAASENHVVGLCKDGTCVSHDMRAVFDNKGQCDVYGWTNVKEIFCGDGWTIGLRDDGSILYAGDQDLSGVREWKNIAAVAGHFAGIVGVTRDGKFLKVGRIVIGACDSAENVVWLANAHFTCALQSNGDLIGGHGDGRDNHVLEKGVLAVAGNTMMLLVLKTDGTVKLLKGSSLLKFPWTGIKVLPDGYDAYVKQLREDERKEQERLSQQAAWREQGVCQYCGGTFVSKLFSKKCSVCGKGKDY